MVQGVPLPLDGRLHESGATTSLASSHEERLSPFSSGGECGINGETSLTRREFMQAAQAKETLPGVLLLEQTPIILEKLLHSAPHDVLQWKPAPDRWSISEVLAHLLDVEQMFSERVRRMVEEQSPQLSEFDEKAVQTKYSSGTAMEHLRKFCHERDRSVATLRYLPASAGARTGQHAKLGTITVNEQMNEWAFHDLGHIRQIAELYRTRAFYEKSGPFQRYANPKP